MTMREIRVTSINVAGVLLMNGIESIGTLRHERSGAVMLRFPGTAASQEILNRYNAGRDRAAEILEGEINRGLEQQPQR
jgi:hypothetical protein